MSSIYFSPLQNLPVFYLPVFYLSVYLCLRSTCVLYLPLSFTVCTCLLSTCVFYLPVYLCLRSTCVLYLPVSSVTPVFLLVTVCLLVTMCLCCPAEAEGRRLKGIQRSTETGLAVDMPSRTVRQASHESIEDSMNSYGSEGKYVLACPQPPKGTFIPTCIRGYYPMCRTCTTVYELEPNTTLEPFYSEIKNPISWCRT